jgi:hypothetical protein
MALQLEGPVGSAPAQPSTHPPSSSWSGPVQFHGAIRIVKQGDGCRVPGSQITSDVKRRCYLILIFLLKDSNHVWKSSK